VDGGTWVFAPNDTGREWVVRHDVRGSCDPMHCLVVAQDVSSTAGVARVIAVDDGVPRDLGDPAQRHAWLRAHGGTVAASTVAWIVSAVGPPELHGLAVAVYPVEMLPDDGMQVAQLRLRRDVAGWSGELRYTFGPSGRDGIDVAVVRWDADSLHEDHER
jgi:hypothetical protein